MTLPANIRVNVRAPFPTQVKGTAFLGIKKANGVWTITPDYRTLGQNITTPTQIVAVQDSATGSWSYVNPALFAAGLYRVITGAGSVSVLPTDNILLLQKSPSGASSILLPASGARAGLPITIKDLTGDANTNNVTIVPLGAETIDGFSAADAAANGVAVIDVDYGWKRLFPLTSGGWYVT
jgi:hypothetical protein